MGVVNGCMLVLSRVRGVSVDHVVDSYWIFLARNHYDLHLEAFKRRLSSDAKAAEAEAVIFSFLWSAKLTPDVFEDPSKGGPDFRCRPRKTEGFLVEVTSLESGPVARMSNLPETITGSGGGAFGLITPLLRGKATAKATQFGNAPLPRVLAIACSHAFSGILMDRLAAENLLVSDYMISVPFGEPSKPAIQVTDLRRSVFLRWDKFTGKIAPCRQSISALLLVAISGIQADVVGILHPEPSVAFAPALFPQIPWLRVRNWPVVDGRIELEWSIGGEEHATFFHERIY